MSSSTLKLQEGGAVFSGMLILEGGGFCGTRASNVNADLSGYDGIRLRVKGDGNRYKLNLRTADAESSENIYQVRCGVGGAGGLVCVGRVVVVVIRVPPV